MTSKYEDQTVDSLDFSSMSDEDLKDVAENDSRSTAQEGAQRELDNRASADGGATADANADVPEGVNLDPDAGQAEVQEKFDRINEVGYLGQTTDPTPDENYTVQTPDDAPTPETDAELFEEARRSSLGSPRTAVDKSSVEVAKERDE